MKFIYGGHERAHRLVGVGIQFPDPVPEQPEMTELRDGHLREGGLIGGRFSERRILDKTKMPQQCTGQHAEQAEQADHALRSAIGRFRGRRPRGVSGRRLRRRGAIRAVLRRVRRLTR